MQKERDSLNAFDVFDRIPAEQTEEIRRDPDAIIVGSRWVRIKKADGRTKARLVAQQINSGTKMDTYAATASGAGAR
eukprot:12070540-Heterocapsa_arctica.AAC.1